MERNDNPPSDAAILAMLAGMHATAASSEYTAGNPAQGARQDQLSAKYRDAAHKARARD